MDQFDFDLVVIGSGPGGYVGAIRGAQLGLKVAVVEKDKLGGVCGNWGCIPSKALIHQASMVSQVKALEALGARVDLSGLSYGKIQEKSRQAAERSSKGVAYLLKKNKIEVIPGTAQITGPHEISVEGQKTLRAKNILVATGSGPRSLPGFEFDEDLVLSSTGILKLTTLPKSLVILGSGAIGMEFAYVMGTLGVEVTVVEMLDRILPLEDKDTAGVVEKSLKSTGIRFITSAKATKLEKSAGGITCHLETATGTQELSAEKILVAIGRIPRTADLGLEAQGVQLDKGYIQVGDYYQTAQPSIFAIGDVVASPLLAHVASKEAEIAVAFIAGKPEEKRLEPDLIPSGIYCEPQIAGFGPTEERAKTSGLPLKVFSFPYLGNGKASATEKTEGLVKILTHGSTGDILGAHIAGAGATEILHEILLAKKAGLGCEEIAGMVHAHPTLSESVMEAARGIQGWAIHI